jgi:uncharacterized protein YgiM (DUF1202 family)
MRKRRTLLMLIGCCVLPVLLAAPGQKVLSIQAERATVRAEPDFTGKIIGSFPEGAQVTVLRQQEEWYQVVDSQRRGGWVHESALSTEPVLMRAGDERVETAATGEEMALATKKFNEQVEDAYRKKNPNLSYEWVDWMEKVSITPETMASFLSDGQVKRSAGGAK